MLLKRELLERIRTGDVDLVFRRWKRPTVKAGGTLKTRVGVLSIDEVEPVVEASITRSQAARAGYGDRGELVADLASREGEVYRIGVRYVGEDPRIALRNEASLSSDDFESIRDRLVSHDRHSRLGPWTGRVLRCLADNEGVRAADLAEGLGYEKKWFKGNVRKLKALGLTESLEVGYRVSPRGRALLRRLG